MALNTAIYFLTGPESRSVFDLFIFREREKEREGNIDVQEKH